MSKNAVSRGLLLPYSGDICLAQRPKKCVNFMLEGVGDVCEGVFELCKEYISVCV